MSLFPALRRQLRLQRDLVSENKKKCRTCSTVVAAISIIIPIMRSVSRHFTSPLFQGWKDDLTINSSYCSSTGPEQDS